jgi:hypothetical protein
MAIMEPMEAMGVMDITNSSHRTFPEGMGPGRTRKRARFANNPDTISAIVPLALLRLQLWGRRQSNFLFCKVFVTVLSSAFCKVFQIKYWGCFQINSD